MILDFRFAICDLRLGIRDDRFRTSRRVAAFGRLPSSADGSANRRSREVRTRSPNQKSQI